jgi:hypothetical protein
MPTKLKKWCGVNYIGCTIDERFVPPLQPLKGMSIKNMYVHELSFGAWGVNDTACTICASENRSYLGEFVAELKKESSEGAQAVLFDGKKPESWKSRDTVPLIEKLHRSNNLKISALYSNHFYMFAAEKKYSYVTSKWKKVKFNMKKELVQNKWITV